jgi:hypothetical protein
MRENGFRDKFMFPVMCSIAIGICSTIGPVIWAKVQSVEWKGVYQSLQSRWYLAGLVVIAFVLWVMLRRMYNYRRLGSLLSDGVMWSVVGPKNESVPRPDSVKVLSPPLCTNTITEGKVRSICETELEEDRNSPCTYVWTCKRCQFRTTSSVSQWERADQLTPKAKSAVQSDLRKRYGAIAGA